MPVLGDDRRVPVARLDGEVQRHAVDGEGQLVVERVRHLAEEAHGEQRVPYPADQRHVVAVRVELGAGLPERAPPRQRVAFHVGAGQRREVARVEVRVRVADRDDDAVGPRAELVAEAALRAAHGPVLVGGLARDLAGLELVERAVERAEAAAELADDGRGRRARGRVPLLHGQDHDERLLGVGLGRERRDRAPERARVLLVVGDRDDVDHVLVPQLRARVAGVALRRHVGVGLLAPVRRGLGVVAAQQAQPPEAARARDDVLAEAVDEPALDDGLEERLFVVRGAQRRPADDAQPEDAVQQRVAREDEDGALAPGAQLADLDGVRLVEDVVLELLLRERLAHAHGVSCRRLQA